MPVKNTDSTAVTPIATPSRSRKLRIGLVSDAAQSLDDRGALPQLLPHRLHARDELTRAERLRHVIVGAELEAEDAVDLAVARGQHDDRDLAGRAQTAADLEAVHSGEHHVEDDK